MTENPIRDWIREKRPVNCTSALTNFQTYNRSRFSDNDQCGRPECPVSC